MKKRKTYCHDRRVTVCLTTQEFEKVEAWSKETTSQTISEYMRNIVTKKPVTFRTRNQTAEDFLEEAIEIKNKLTTMGEELDETVNRLYRHPDKIHFKTAIENIDVNVFSILQRTEDIRFRMTQIYKLWSQK